MHKELCIGLWPARFSRATPSANRRQIDQDPVDCKIVLELFLKGGVAVSWEWNWDKNCWIAARGASQNKGVK
jgi:hypothetical protein